MNKTHHRVWLIAAAALLVAGGVGCKRTDRPAPDMIDGLVPVAIAPTLAQNQNPGSRLTPSTPSAAGAFESGDQVGLFLYDQRGLNFSTANECYTANGSVKFIPTAPVYYKTYANHGIYAYFPYDASVTSAKQLTFRLKTDQTVPADRIQCDFLSSSHKDIVPQQIDPNAAEIPMTFYHQMTSIVVLVRNSDGSSLSDNLTDRPVKVWLVKRATSVDVDLTNFSKDGTTSYEACDLSNRGTPNHIILGHNPAKDILVTNTMYFEGIAIPDAVLANVELIKIQIGKDENALTLPYLPKAGDAIVTSGLAQGKEHIFELTIKGPELLVQGGEINDWGTGASMSDAINGGGVTSTQLIFDLTNSGSVANVEKITKCNLVLDGVTYPGEVTYNPPSAGAARLTCSVNTGKNFPYWFTQATFYDKDNGKILETNAVATNTIRIKGNPLDPNYNQVLATIDGSTKNVTQQ